MASIIKVDTLQEKTSGNGIVLENSLKDSTGANEIISPSGSINPTNLVGMIASFAMSSAPSGWLVCNGAEYAIADYGDLYTAIGTIWGSLTNGSGGAGTSHFVVPDLRGEFLRGFDNGQGNDPDAASRTGGDAVGSSQSHQFQQHRHSFYISSTQIFNTRLFGPASQYDTSIARGTASTGSGSGVWDAYTGNYGDETRPRNKYVQYCIKF